MYLYCIAPYGKLESNFIKVGFCTKIESLKKRYSTYYGSSHRCYYVEINHSCYEDKIHQKLKKMGLHIENELFVYNRVNDFYFYVQQLNEVKSNEFDYCINNVKNTKEKFQQLTINNYSNNEFMLFIDKYKSIHYKDVCGNKNNIKKIIDWFYNWNLNTKKCLLLTGPVGIGKTLSIELICKNLNYDIIYLNDEKLESLIEKNNNKSLYNKNKVLIIDGCDFLYNYEKNNKFML